VIFYVHDVAQQPSHMGCTPSLLRSTIKAVQDQNFQCLSIRQALPVIGYSANSEVAEIPSPRSIAVP
jgi:hypothetical protein